MKYVVLFENVLLCFVYIYNVLSIKILLIVYYRVKNVGEI